MTAENKIMPINEKRRHPRVDSSNRVNFMLFDSKKKPIGRGKGWTINISQSGVLLQTKEKLEGAFIMVMAIDLDGKKIKFNGKIKTSRFCTKTNFYFTGIEFIGPKDKQHLSIVIFIKDFQRRKYIRNQQQTKELLRLLSLAIEQSSEGVIITNLKLTVTYLNQSFSEMHDYTPEENIGKNLSIFHNEKQMVAVTFAIKQIKHTGQFKGEVWHQKRDGSIFPMAMYFSMIRDDAGKPIGILGTGRDITQRKKNEQALRKSEEKYRMILENIEDGFYEVDLEGNYTSCNSSLCKIFGYSKNELIGLNFRKYVDPKDAEKVFKKFNEVFTSGEPKKAFDWAMIKKDGTRCYIDTSISLITNSSNTVTGFQGIVRDITQRKQTELALKEREEKYRELSIIDALTQLYNSRHFFNQLKMEIDRVNRYNESLTLILLDIDNFKNFNDKYGHIAGDHALMRLGQMIKTFLRKTDSAYRYGGEEFTIILPSTKFEDGVFTADRLKTIFKKENFATNSGEEIHLTLSLGVGQYKPQEEIKDFIHRVDQLMYQAKNHGKDRVCYNNIEEL